MKKAFTLIELLVVIAIIAILAAILFPVFAQAKEAAKKTQCLSNVKNLATAAQLYGGDYDDTVLPEFTCSGAATYCSGGPTLTDLRTWTYVIQPYVKNGGGHPKSGIFTDPSFSLANFYKGADQAVCDGNGTVGSAGFSGYSLDAAGKERSYSDYGIVFAMCAPSDATAAHPCTSYTDYKKNGVTVDGSTAALSAFLYPGSLNYPASKGGLTRGFGEIARPAETVIVGDGSTFVGLVGGAGPYFIDAIGCESTFMHSQGGNFGFCDGHAKFLKGNPEGYRKQAPSGIWIETYFYYAE